MPTMLADLHLHTDRDEARGNWHGMSTNDLAEAIVASPVDIIAITEHNRVHADHFRSVVAQIDALAAQAGRRIDVLLGAELSVGFSGNRYHVGYIFEEDFSERTDMPEVPELGVSLHKLEEYRQYYPGVAIFNHPTWKDGCASDHARTRDLMQSGLVDGIEIVNGLLILNANGHGARISADGLALFLRARTADPTLAAIGSSDAHKKHQVASAATLFEGTGPEDLFREIKKGQTRAVPLHEGVRRVAEALLQSQSAAAEFIDTHPHIQG